MKALKALGVLAFVELAAFGVFSSRIGFYHDDWVLLDQMSSARGFVEQARAMRWLAPRPLDIPLNQAFYAFGGLNPLPYHLLRLCLDVAAGWLFFLLVERLTRRRVLALLAAALAVLVPNRDVLHFWFGIGNESAALVLMFASLLVYREGRRAAGLALYLASVLTYEALAFFPLVLAAERPLEPRRALRELWPFGPILGAALAWQRVGAAVYTGSENNKVMGFSFAHAIKVFGAGFECVSNRVLHICALSLAGLWSERPWYLVACALPVAAMTGLLLKGKDEASEASAWPLAAALFVAAYLPYAAAIEYMPQIFGVMSRTNAGGAWACGLMLASLLASLEKPAAKAALLGLVVFAFTATDWQRARAWGRAWDAQRDVLARLKEKNLPRGAKILLANPPEEKDHTVVFEAEYAFDSALRVMSGRRDLRGNLLSLEKDPPESALVYDAQTDVLSSRK